MAFGIADLVSAMQGAQQKHKDELYGLASQPLVRPEVREHAFEQWARMSGLLPQEKQGKGKGQGGGGPLHPLQAMLGAVGGGLQKAFSPTPPGWHNAQQAMEQAFQSTGRPETTTQIPAGPGALSNVLPAQTERIGPVAPSLMLSPQEQLNIKLDETRATEKQKRELTEQAEAGMRRIQLDADEAQKRKNEEVRSSMALDSWNKYQMLKGIYPEEAAKEISGWKDHEQIKGAPKLVHWDDPELVAWADRTGTPRPPEGSQWYAYTDAQGRLSNAMRGPDIKESKPSSEFSGTLKEDVQAQGVVSDYEAAQRTGRKSKYTEAEYKAAKDFLTKQNRPPAFIMTKEETDSESKDIAQAIREHRMPPTLTGFGRGGLAGKVAKELSKMKDDTGQPFNLAKQQLDWEATRQHIRSLNGAQQTRLQEATTFSISSLNRLSNPDNPGQDIIGQLRRFVPRSQYPILNRAAIKAAKENAFGDAAASAATQLESQIGDLQLELGTVYMGGNSPTDKSLGRAKDMLAGEWSENVLRDGVDLSRANLGYRLNSITQSQPMGVSAENPYATTPTPVPEPPIVNRGAQEALPNSPRKGAKLDAGTARKFLDAFNGDKQQAFNEAKKRGWEP